MNKLTYKLASRKLFVFLIWIIIFFTALFRNMLTDTIYTTGGFMAWFDH
jgi:hypothetical protein